MLSIAALPLLISAVGDGYYTVFAAEVHKSAAGTLTRVNDQAGRHTLRTNTGTEVNMTGGYDPTITPQKSALLGEQAAVYRRNGIGPVFWPRLAGSWPGYVFTGEPLNPGGRPFRPGAR